MYLNIARICIERNKTTCVRKMLITAALITAVQCTPLIVYSYTYFLIVPYNCLTVDSWKQSISYLEAMLFAFLNAILDNCQVELPTQSDSSCYAETPDISKRKLSSNFRTELQTFDDNTKLC